MNLPLQRVEAKRKELAPSITQELQSSSQLPEKLPGVDGHKTFPVLHEMQSTDVAAEHSSQFSSHSNK